MQTSVSSQKQFVYFNIVLHQEAYYNVIKATESQMFPQDFAEKAWPSYLQCIRDRNYYFSVEEIIIMASVANVRLLVLRDSGDGCLGELWKRCYVIVQCR